MDLQLEGRVAIVTGAGRGLGRAAVVALVGEGVKVLGVARSRDELDELVADLPGSVQVAVCDMRNEEDVSALVAHALVAFGRLDIVVNNAGVAPAGPFLDASRETWADTFAVNVRAPAVLSQTAAAHFAPMGAGRIINVASTAGIRGKPSLAIYSASKAALIALSTTLAAEWARYGIQVNVIAPGAFATSAQRAVLEDDDLLARRLRKIPAHRIADPKEFGPLVCYLASPLSDFVTGSVVAIDGGELAKL